MDRCTGPCCGEIDRGQYQEIVHQVKMFLEGKNKDLVESLKKKMEEESEQLHFEKAAKIRDQIDYIEHVIEKQKMVSSDFVDQDVIGFHRQNRTFAIHPLFVRGGKLLGGKGFTFPSKGLPDEEASSSPSILPKTNSSRTDGFRILPEQTLIEQWLTELKSKRVRILVPLKGDKKHLKCL
jgi:excinuclease ABC subunit C